MQLNNNGTTYWPPGWMIVSLAIADPLCVLLKTKQWCQLVECGFPFEVAYFSLWNRCPERTHIPTVGGHFDQMSESIARQKTVRNVLSVNICQAFVNAVNGHNGKNRSEDFSDGNLITRRQSDKGPVRTRRGENHLAWHLSRGWVQWTLWFHRFRHQ